MPRALVACALFLIPTAAYAQSGRFVPVGPPMVGGRVVTAPPITNGASALYPVRTPAVPRFGIGGGSLTGAPQVLVPSGSWGGVSYSWPRTPVVFVPAPVASGEVSATLVLQFPASAEVWDGGKKRSGGDATEWTFTSPKLKPGSLHTFEVRGRWTTGGKTFEATRSVTVVAGERTRSIVLTGTEIKD